MANLPNSSSQDPLPGVVSHLRIAELTQEELDALPAEKRLELLEAHRHREDQERERRRQNRHQWFNSVGILFGVLFTAAGLVVTALTLRAGQDELRTAREGQITDRYAKAVEQLASPAAEARLGAMYALQRIAADSPKDRLTIRSVLAAFVGNHDFCTTQPPARQCTASLTELTFVRTAKRLPSDVQTAMTIASSLSLPGDEPVDFSQVRFPRVELAHAGLSRANLRGVDLTWADLSGANLSYVNATGACLTMATLDDADLSNANLRGADLYSAQLGDANLTGTDLRDANLREVTGMTPEEIQKVAVTNAETTFEEKQTSPASPELCGPDSTRTDRPLHPR
ncbi:pentapeptide repeat-containing protein [Streptosporangium canum]|uniref:pentapeptide repeat-containing protein n=1 Tax=Streptosporangium canum TaxID=324952 RepID=UPI003426600D